jgi:hypothetical protein
MGLEERVSIVSTHKLEKSANKLAEGLGLSVIYDSRTGVAVITKQDGTKTKVMGGIRMVLTFLKGYEWAFKLTRFPIETHQWSKD